MPKSVLTEDEQELTADMEAHSECTIPFLMHKDIIPPIDDSPSKDSESIKDKIEDYINRITAEESLAIKTTLTRELTEVLLHNSDLINCDELFKIFIVFSDRLLFLREIDPAFLQSKLDLIRLNAFLANLPSTEALVFLLCRANLNLDLDQIQLGSIAKTISSDATPLLKELLLKKKSLLDHLEEPIPYTTSSLSDNSFVRDLCSLYPPCAKTLSLIPDQISKILYILQLLPDPQIETIEAFDFELVMHTKEIFIRSLNSTALASIENLFEFSLMIQMFPMAFRLNIIIHLLTVDSNFLDKVKNFRDIKNILDLIPNSDRIQLLQHLRFSEHLHPTNSSEIVSLLCLIPDSSWHELNPLYFSCFAKTIQDIATLTEIMRAVLKHSTEHTEISTEEYFKRSCNLINCIDKKNIHNLINTPSTLQTLYNLCNNVEQAIALTQALDLITYRSWGIWIIIRNKTDLLTWLHECKFDMHLFVAKLGLTALNILTEDLEDLLLQFRSFSVINLDNIKKFTEILVENGKLFKFIDGDLLNFHKLMHILPATAKSQFYSAIPQDYIVGLFSQTVRTHATATEVDEVLPKTPDTGIERTKSDEDRIRDIYEQLLAPTIPAVEGDSSYTSPLDLAQTIYGLPISAKEAGFKTIKTDSFSESRAHTPSVPSPSHPLKVITHYAQTVLPAAYAATHSTLRLAASHRGDIMRFIIAYRSPAAAAAERAVPLIYNTIRRYYGV